MPTASAAPPPTRAPRRSRPKTAAVIADIGHRVDGLVSPARVAVCIGDATYRLDQLGSPADIAAMTGKTVETIRLKCASGELPSVRFGRPPADPTRDRRRILVPFDAAADLFHVVAPASAPEVDE